MLSLLSRRIITSPLRRSLTILPPNLNKKYLPNEEWISDVKEGVKFGITENAVEQMGEIVFLEYGSVSGDVVEKNDELATIESVKSVQILNAPFDCVVVETNNNLEECLDSLNESPEDEENSWIFKLEKRE